MGKSKHVGNKHLYLGTSKDPKRMDMYLDDVVTNDSNVWKKDDKALLKRIQDARKIIKEKDILNNNNNNKKETTYNLQSFSYTIFAKGRQNKYGNKL